MSLLPMDFDILPPSDDRVFELFLHRQYIRNELTKAKEKSKDPNTQWLSEDEFWAVFVDSQGNS